MNNKIAVALVVGVIFSLISLMTIKNSIYYYDAEVIPKGLFKDNVKYFREKMKKAKVNSKSSDHYTASSGRSDYEEAEDYLSRHREEKTYNYVVALISLIGGIGVGYLLSDKILDRGNKLLDRRKDVAKFSIKEHLDKNKH